MTATTKEVTGRVPAIATISSQTNRPFWSVMIPAYNPLEDYLEEALASVLLQDSGPERMQIEVVDDGSPTVDVASMVKRIAGDRVAYFRTAVNLGLAGCWNTCIERSRGVWVHILHQDDYVLPGFYEHLEQTASTYPEVSLLATRSFLVDGDGVIEGVTGRLHKLENGGNDVSDFFYFSPIQCPGVVVQRCLYEQLGGFRTDLAYTLDCEMWARAISSAGGVVSPKVLAAYRCANGNESDRMARTAEGLEDMARLSAIFAERYPGFDRKKVKRNICGIAMMRARKFAQLGDQDAAAANLRYWQQNAPVRQRLRNFIGGLLRKAADSPLGSAL